MKSMSAQMSFKFPLLKEVNGCLFFATCSDECIDYALKYKPSDDDIFVVTYPKCGTTWTQNIVNLILSDGLQCDHWGQYWESNIIEMNGTNTVMKPTIKSHLPYDLLPKNPLTKYLVVFRNPKDTVVSYNNYVSKRWSKRKATERVGVLPEFHVFFDKWFEGDVNYGSYFEHTYDYWTHRFDKNILYLVYEQMVRNPKQAIVRIAEFFGKEFEEKLLANNELVLNEVLNQSSIDYMKAVSTVESVYVRKGVVGDWRSQLTRDESDLIDEKFTKYFAGSELQNIWREDMKWQ